MRKRKRKVPWREWEYQSSHTRAYDSFFKGCGTPLFRVPFTLDYAIQDTKYHCNHFLSCNPSKCTLYDDLCYELDICHYRKFTPPPVRPVNRNYAFVMGRHDGIHGPFEFHEWKQYSWNLWDWFFDLKDDENALIEDNLHYQWSQVYFRHPKDFIGGHYGLYSDILMPMCAYFEDTYTKHRSYADVWDGSDLFENIEPVDIHQARDFRNHGKLFNFTVPHLSNCKKHGIDPTKISPLELRNQDRQAVERFKARIKRGDTALTTYTDPQGDPYKSWYKMAKHIPLRLVNDKVQPAIFDNNQELIDQYWDESLDTIQGFFDCKCIELMPENYVPDLSGTVNIDNNCH